MSFQQLCAVCREPFIAQRRSARFCGATHRKQHHRNPAAYRLKAAPVTLSAVSVALRVVPLTLAEANAAVERWHRHHVRAVAGRVTAAAKQRWVRQLAGKVAA
jgi:hypothetical protein